MTSGRTPLGAALRSRVAAGLLAALAAGCACPTPVERWDTPQQTLELWQAHLCRDEVEGEYGCLSPNFQAAMQGFETYYARRSQLLAEQPAAAWLFSHADLASHVLSSTVGADGQHATIVLAAGDNPVCVSFEREAWVTITWDDGHFVSARQRVPLPSLVVRDARRQWLALPHPELEDAAHVLDVQFSSRWLISDLAGLAGGDPHGSPSP